jgi:hypothetical protein
MTERETILAHCIPHECRVGQCGGGHERGLLEFPSLVFVEMCAVTLAARKPEAGPLAPD